MVFGFGVKKLRNVSKLGYNINIFIVAVNQYYSVVTCYNSTLRRTTSYEDNANVYKTVYNLVMRQSSSSVH